MADVTALAKRAVRTALAQLGLLSLVQAHILRPARKAAVDMHRRKFRRINTFIAKLETGLEAQFSTEDTYSKRWFFPRYGNGVIHEQLATEKMLSVLGPSDCFVDVGAHIGWFTCIAAKHVNQGKVFSFEMDDMAFRLLENNVKLNELTNVEAHLCAVSDVDGTVSYARSGREQQPNPHRRLTRMRGSEGLPEVSVRSFSMDSFFSSRNEVPKLIKIDVEGAELLVLRGARHTLTTHRPHLLLEVHPGRHVTAEMIVNFLRETGYNIWQIMPLKKRRTNGMELLRSDGSEIQKVSMLYCEPLSKEDKQLKVLEY